MASGAGNFSTSTRRTPPPPPHSPTHPIHDNGRHTAPIAEGTLKNVDLGGGGSGSGHGHTGRSPTHTAVVAGHTQATRRRDHASASSSSSAASHEQPCPPRQSRGHGRGHAASSTWTLVWAQIKRFDIEWSIGFLIIIFICSAVAVFTRDKGWFLATAPLDNFPLVNTLASFSIGLSTYVTQAHAGDEHLTLYRHEGPISELSPRAGHIAVFLYVCLVASLLLSVGLLWYIALFYQYLKSSEVLPSRELAVRLLGLKALTLGLLLLGLGTGTFRAVIWDDLKHSHNNSSSSSSGGSSSSSGAGPTSFTDIDSSELTLETGYAYALTVAAWFFWLIVGSVFLFRSCCWAKGAGLAVAREEEEGMEGEMEDGGRVLEGEEEAEV